MITFIHQTRTRSRFYLSVGLALLCLAFVLTGALLPGQSVQADNNRAVQAVVSFTLINARDDVPIGTLTEDYVVDCSAIGTLSLNIRANTTPANVGSVRFGLDDTPDYRIENSQPYSLGGNTNGNYNGWKPVDGIHTITATPYSAKNATGTAGTALTIQIIASACVAPTVTPTPTDTQTQPINTSTSTATATQTNIPTEVPTSAGTSTPTDVPATNTNTATPLSTATVTATPTLTPISTVTATSPAEIELVDNGSFEVDTDGDKIPDNWSLKNTSRDKRICNRTNPPKQVAYIGECAFQFKSVPGENSKLLHFATLSGALNSGDNLTLTGFVQAKGSVNLLIKVNIKYADGFLPQGKLKMTVNTPLSAYTAFSDLSQALAYTLVGVPNKIKILVANKGVSGKIRLDGIGLLLTDTAARHAALLPVP